MSVFLLCIHSREAQWLVQGQQSTGKMKSSVSSCYFIQGTYDSTAWDMKA